MSLVRTENIDFADVRVSSDALMDFSAVSTASNAFSRLPNSVNADLFFSMSFSICFISLTILFFSSSCRRTTEAASLSASL